MAKNQVEVDIKFNIKMSFWDALKLRLAGATHIREHIERKLKEEKNEEKETTYT